MKKAKMRNVIAILLTVIMLLVTAACGDSKPAPDTTAPPQGTSAEPVSAFGEGKIVDKKITLKVMQSSYESKQIDKENTMWFYDELEKKTNIHIIWDYVIESDWNTRLNLMFSSGDYPDVIARGKLDVEEYGVSQGILVPLDEYIPKYMPNYYSRLHLNDAGKSIPASDGKSYYIGHLIAQNVNHIGNHYINKAWLDKLGLQIPKTIDELTDVLRAFRDNDPNGNNQKDEIPFTASDLTNSTQGVYTHFASFGVPLNDELYVNIDKNDKVVFSGFMPGFRAACEWLNMCYNEELLDPASITQDVSTWGAKVNDGKAGYTTYLRRLNSMWNQYAIDSFVSIIPPASSYGVQVSAILEVPEIGAALTIANKYIPETLQWIDAQLETETMMVAYNGPIKEDGPIEPTMFINDKGKYEVKYVPADNALYDYCPVLGGQFFAPGDYYFEIYEMAPHRVERFETSKAYREAGVLEPKSFYYLTKLSKMSNEDALEAGQLYIEIQKFMKESIANFITKGVTDESWNKFLETAKNIKVERYVELYQGAYDNYLTSSK